MSTFNDLEESVQESLPVECYRFTGSFKNYYYTSSEKAVMIGADVYQPVAVSRSRIKAGTHEDDSLQLDLEIPFDVPVVKDYAFAQTPPKLYLEVFRQQGGDPTIFSPFWQGEVRGFSVNDRTASIRVPSIFSNALQGEIPNVYYQAPCNHVLYDDRCGISRAAHTVSTIILSVTDGVNVVTTTAPAADGVLVAGELVNTRNGERRMILANIGNNISLGYPFVDLRPGDTVDLIKGCDHSLPTCKAKFNNVINFGGFHYIPAENPFDGSAA